MKMKNYEVLNPRGVPQGTQVISIEGQGYFEGDIIGLDRETAADLVARGFLTEVKRG